MLLAHLSDLHLGHRAFDRTDGGRNVRERDVAAAFQRAVQEVIRLKPDLIFLLGDIFDRPDPPPGALVELARGLESFRSAIPDTQIFMVAGARDTPRPMTDPGALAALDPFPQVEAVTGTARSLFLREMETHVYLVPHGAVVRRPYPQLRIHPEARWNLLLAYAGVGTGAGPGVHLDPAPWDYVALGFLHQHQQVAPKTFYSGSLERVGPEPWREAAQEKGFLTYDLESGVSRFHAIPVRPVVALAPIRVPHGEASQLPGRVREVLGEVPGGIDGKIVRLRIEGLSPEEVKREDPGLFAPLRARALHLAVDVDDFQSIGEDNPLPLAARDRGFALRALREQIRSGGGDEVMRLLDEILGTEVDTSDSPGLEEDLLLRELHASNLPFLGDLSMEAREGLLAWMGGDGRTLRAFSGSLLWGVGLRSAPVGGQSAVDSEREPKVAVRLGMQEESFWVRNGPAGAEMPFAGEGTSADWGLSAAGVALAWCGEGVESPETLLDQGAEVLASSRGVGRLDDLMERLAGAHPGLRKDGFLGELSARDYERLRLESELADLRAQIRALEDIPSLVNRLEGELRELRGSQAEVTGDMEAATMDWHRERQDAETHLQAYRDRAREMRHRINTLKKLGPESACPTCGRVLAESAEKVLRELNEEWENLVQDGQWWRRRWEQLEEKPEDLRTLEGRSLRLNSEMEDCTERLERARSALRELDELRVREKEVRGRWEFLKAEDDGAGAEPGSRPAGIDLETLNAMEPPEEARILFNLGRDLAEEIREECRVRLLNRGGRRLNRLTGGRILGLRLEGRGGGVHLVEGGVGGGVEADQDQAAATVALRMALVELLSEDWSPLGSFVLGDPFDRMGFEDQLRCLSLLRRILSRVPQVLLLTRGSVVERAPEFFDGLFEYRESAAKGLPALRTLPAGVGILRIR